MKLELFNEAETFLRKSLGMGHERSREQLETCERVQRVSFQWKNPDFLSKNPDFLLKNVDFIIRTGLRA